MKTFSSAIVLLGALVLLAGSAWGQVLVNTDFAKGDFAALGWQAEDGWDVHNYPQEVANNPGAVARFPAGKPAGKLVKTFDEVKSPKKMTLDLDYGWGWGDIGQGADMVAFMLVDAKGNGYTFELHRVKAKWAVQWAKVTNNAVPKDKTWAKEDIDASHASIQAGGGMSHLTVTREATGTWTIASKDWNQGTGGAVKFTDGTTNSYCKLVLLGTQNFDEQAFNKIVLEVSK